MFGMIQPDPSRKAAVPALYRTGCAGRITAYSETQDGRVLLSLTGLIRFDIVSELPTIRGYRMVVPDWTPYAADLELQDDPNLFDRSRITSALGRYLRQRNMETDWQALEKVPPRQLVNSMATLLPISAVEKQAILEAREPDECADILLTTLEMSLGDGPGMSRH
jgi:Lon protease-like protein